MPKFHSPQELLSAYSNGLRGAYCDPIHYQQFVSTLKLQNFGAAGLNGTGEGKLSTPYKSVVKLSPVKNPLSDRQETNDCVSFCTHHATDITRAAQVDANHREVFVTVSATESIYGSRNTTSDNGMNCSRAAEFVSKDGGILLRQNYEGITDLTKYSSSKAVAWGGGMPEALIAIARKHQVKTVTPVTTTKQARDALHNGYGISVCSNYGYSSTRDSKGFAKQQGSWSHGLCFGACDATNGENAFMIINSWAKWNDGGHPSWGPIPDGCFLIHEEDAAGMISAGACFAFSFVDGFPPTKLPDYGTGDYL